MARWSSAGRQHLDADCHGWAGVQRSGVPIALHCGGLSLRAAVPARQCAAAAGHANAPQSTRLARPRRRPCTSTHWRYLTSHAPLGKPPIAAPRFAVTGTDQRRTCHFWTCRCNPPPQPSCFSSLATLIQLSFASSAAERERAPEQQRPGPSAIPRSNPRVRRPTVIRPQQSRPTIAAITGAVAVCSAASAQGAPVAVVSPPASSVASSPTLRPDASRGRQSVPHHVDIPQRRPQPLPDRLANPAPRPLLLREPPRTTSAARRQ